MKYSYFKKDQLFVYLFGNIQLFVYLLVIIQFVYFCVCFWTFAVHLHSGDMVCWKTIALVVQNLQKSPWEKNGVQK